MSFRVWANTWLEWGLHFWLCWLCGKIKTELSYDVKNSCFGYYFHPRKCVGTLEVVRGVSWFGGSGADGIGEPGLESAVFSRRVHVMKSPDENHASCHCSLSANGYRAAAQCKIKRLVKFSPPVSCNCPVGHSRTNRPTLNTLIFQKNLKLGLWGSLTGWRRLSQYWSSTSKGQRVIASGIFERSRGRPFFDVR